VTEIHEQDGLAMGRVEFGGVLKDICLAYTHEAQIGDYVLVHVGFAISRIDEAEAREIFEYIEEIENAAADESQERITDTESSLPSSSTPRLSSP
jgi:hydrogenase expression/formation protein HypC